MIHFPNLFSGIRCGSVCTNPGQYSSWLLQCTQHCFQLRCGCLVSQLSPTQGVIWLHSCDTYPVGQLHFEHRFSGLHDTLTWLQSGPASLHPTFGAEKYGGKRRRADQIHDLHSTSHRPQCDVDRQHWTSSLSRDGVFSKPSAIEHWLIVFTHLNPLNPSLNASYLSVPAST